LHTFILEADPAIFTGSSCCTEIHCTEAADTFLSYRTGNGRASIDFAAAIATDATDCTRHTCANISTLTVAAKRITAAFFVLAWIDLALVLSADLIGSTRLFRVVTSWGSAYTSFADQLS
jgi:hypothetical protein